MIFIFFVHIILSSFTQALDQSDLSRNQEAYNKVNVVLFFAHYTSACSSFNKNNLRALNYLHLVQTAKVKHCSTSPGKFSMSDGRLQRNCNCKESLRSSLETLINFCENVLGMHAAIVNLNDDASSMDLQQQPQEQSREPIEQQPKPLQPQESIPAFAKRKSKEVAKDLITESQHSEVFKIRTKRVSQEKPQEIIDVPLGHETTPTMGFINVIADIKYSFFGNLFKNPPNNTKEDYDVQPQQLGEVKDFTLFENVKNTLTGLQTSADVPFLLIVFGGNLSDISDCQSPLIQSIKYIVENTAQENTLIVLTGSCPESNPNEVNINEDATASIIPVYAKGPLSEEFSNCDELYDVPIVIKNALAHIQADFEGFQPNVGEFRQKRSLFGNIPPNKEKLNSRAVNIVQSPVIFYLLLSILFLL